MNVSPQMNEETFQKFERFKVRALRLVARYESEIRKKSPDMRPYFHARLNEEKERLFGPSLRKGKDTTRTLLEWREMAVGCRRSFNDAIANGNLQLALKSERYVLYAEHQAKLLPPEK